MGSFVLVLSHHFEKRTIFAAAEHSTPWSNSAINTHTVFASCVSVFHGFSFAMTASHRPNIVLANLCTCANVVCVFVARLTELLSEWIHINRVHFLLVPLVSLRLVHRYRYILCSVSPFSFGLPSSRPIFDAKPYSDSRRTRRKGSRVHLQWKFRTGIAEKRENHHHAPENST